MAIDYLFKCITGSAHRTFVCIPFSQLFGPVLRLLSRHCHRQLDGTSTCFSCTMCSMCSRRTDVLAKTKRRTTQFTVIILLSQRLHLSRSAASFSFTHSMKKKKKKNGQCTQDDDREIISHADQFRNEITLSMKSDIINTFSFSFRVCRWMAFSAPKYARTRVRERTELCN